MTDKQTLKQYAKKIGVRLDEYNNGAHVRVSYVKRPQFYVVDVWPDPLKGFTKYHIVGGTRKNERGIIRNPAELKELLQELEKDMAVMPERDPNKKESYTINSDASYMAYVKRGSYAYWIKGDDGFHVKHAGVFRDHLPNSSVAELLAFEKALQELNKKIPLERRKDVLIFVNTDCQWVIDVLEGRVLNSKYRILMKAVRHAARDYEIVARHVKAHTGDLTQARSWVNNWCDKQAKTVLKEELGI